MAEPKEVVLELPEKLLFLVEKKARYKVAHGGRGSAKSWSFARSLLVLGAHHKLRILCAREVQKSIKDSVHKLLSDQIEALGLGSAYTVLDTEIRGRNGTEFLFSGLAQHTVDSIKSFEGVDICWVEEAHTVSKRSWDVLTPTIRKAGSEVWISFNPELDTDEVWVRFVENPPPDAIVCQINWPDNPWFSVELEGERLHSLRTRPEDYDNIWEGKPRSSVLGAIYADEVQALLQGNRYGLYEHDPLHLTHTIWDLGWNDAMTISMVQKVANNLIIVDYIEESHRTYDWYVKELNARGYNWGTDFLPHDGEHRNPQTGKSAKEVLEALGRTVEITPNLPVEDGIKIVRQTFPHIFMNAGKTERLLQCCRRYRREINRSTGEPGKPLHDEWSHGADNIRYLAINAERLQSQRALSRPAPRARQARAASWKLV